MRSLLSASASGLLALSLVAGAWAPRVEAQARRGATPAQRPAATATRTEPAQIQCPSPLGAGVVTKATYCDVLTGRDPLEGILVTIPPHTGPVVLTFDLHNRHLYSEELVRANRAYRQYTATIGVLTMNVDLLSRFVVQSEFRTAADLVDRIAAETGTAAVKAVAPTGTEPVRLTIAAGEERVSILGEKLSVIRPDVSAPDTFTTSGRPIAVISNVMLEYRPAPARAPARRR